MWSLRTLAPAEWPGLADFIHAHNRRDDGRARCLHFEQETLQAQADELRSFAAGSACFVAAHEGETLRGVVGAEFDAGLRRAWVRAPLTHGAGGAEALRPALLAALHDALPQALRFDAFPQVDEAPLRDGLRAAGYRDHVQHHVMEWSATVPAPDWPASVRDALPDDHAHVAALHDALFPATYLPAEAMLASIDADHRLLVAAGPGTAAFGGYLYVQRRTRENDAYIDFIGVAPAARGHGLGRALLDAALHWVCRSGLVHVSLTVRQDRAPALGLYTSAGFREVAAGAQMIFERET
jgi:GNAT superfamily N-acetyltransferase